MGAVSGLCGDEFYSGWKIPWRRCAPLSVFLPGESMIEPSGLQFMDLKSWT